MAITKITTVTLGAGGSASIDFSTIPSTFTDVMLVYSLRTTQASASASIGITINSSSSTFTMRGLYGNGSTATAFTTPTTYAGEADGANATTSTFSNGSIYFPNYAGSTNKPYSIDGVSESNTGTVIQVITSGLWSTTSAINAISLVTTSGTFVQYSTASLYGITKGSSGSVTVS